jgi:hypothetical protein
LFLTACTAPAGEPTAAPTAAATLRPTATPRPTATAIPTATTAPHLTIDGASLMGITVRFWHPFTNDAAAQLREMVNTFNSDNPYGIRVEAYSLGAGAALQERMQTELALDAAEAQLPNVVAGSSLLLHSWADALQPLDDYLAHPEWGAAQVDPAQFDALALAQGVTPGGARIALPLLRSAPVLYLNRTWAEELGFAVDGTDPAAFSAADFSAIACAAYQALLDDDEPANNGTGGWVISLDENNMLSWLRAYGYTDLAPQDGLFRFNTPQSEAAFNALWSLNNQSCAWTSRQPTPYDYFATRRAVLFSGTLRDVDLVRRALEQAGNADQFVILPYPGPQGSPAQLWESSGIALLQGTAEEQLAGWVFITWLLESRQLALLSISTHSMPVHAGALPWMQVYFDDYPQWAALQDWPLPAESLPQHTNWMTAGNVLEDAAWQLFQSYTRAEDIPLILEQLDALIAAYESPTP